MSALSADQQERARKNLSAVFRGIQSVGQVAIAQGLCVSEGTVSKIKNDDVPRLADMLALCGLKVVPEAFQCYQPRVIEAILALAQDRLSRVHGSHELELDQE